MKWTIPHFIILSLLCINKDSFGQNFVHDTLVLVGNEYNCDFFYGLTTPADLTSAIMNCKTKTRIKKVGRGEDKSFTKEYIITLPDGYTNFHFSESNNEKSLLKDRGKLSLVSITSKSLYIINGKDLAQKTRIGIEKELSEGEPDDSRKNTFYYSEEGIEIRYKSKSKEAIVKGITFYESPKIAEQNFQIYLDWKAKQPE